AAETNPAVQAASSLELRAARTASSRRPPWCSTPWFSSWASSDGARAHHPHPPRCGRQRRSWGPNRDASGQPRGLAVDILSTLLALCRVLLLVAITVGGIVAGLVWGAFFAIVNFGELAGIVAVA